MVKWIELDVDKWGRITIPKTFRDMLEIEGKVRAKIVKDCILLCTDERFSPKK